MIVPYVKASSLKDAFCPCVLDTGYFPQLLSQHVLSVTNRQHVTLSVTQRVPMLFNVIGNIT